MGEVDFAAGRAPEFPGDESPAETGRSAGQDEVVESAWDNEVGVFPVAASVSHRGRELPDSGKSSTLVGQQLTYLRKRSMMSDMSVTVFDASAVDRRIGTNLKMLTKARGRRYGP